MAMKSVPGVGGKRPLQNLSPDQLILDPNNPRLPVSIQGKTQEDIIYTLYRGFDLEELAVSMAENGYFDEEPLVAIPCNLPDEFVAIAEKSPESLSTNDKYKAFITNPITQFTVMEGNRRLSTVKLLLSNELRKKFRINHWPTIRANIQEDLKLLPTIIYPIRREVLPYMGVRHITGIKKWEPYAKARYIADMVEQGMSIDMIQQQVGDRSNSSRKFYLCYQLVEQAKNEFDLDTTAAENFFSYLVLATGNGSFKDFLGLPKQLLQTNLQEPVPSANIQNLKHLFSWLFGEGRDVSPVIKESRDITNKLASVLKNTEATRYLIESRNLDEAFDRSAGESESLLKKLNKVKTNLDTSMPLISRHNTKDVKEKVREIRATLDGIFTLLKMSI